MAPHTHTIREQLAQLGFRFQANYAYNSNGTVWDADFYTYSQSAAKQRHRYQFSYDALDRLTNADFWRWDVPTQAWEQTSAYDIANLTYDVVGNLRTLRRHVWDGTVYDDMSRAADCEAGGDGKQAGGVHRAGLGDVAQEAAEGRTEERKAGSSERPPKKDGGRAHHLSS